MSDEKQGGALHHLYYRTTVLASCVARRTRKRLLDGSNVRRLIHSFIHSLNSFLPSDRYTIQAMLLTTYRSTKDFLEYGVLNVKVLLSVCLSVCLSCVAANAILRPSVPPSTTTRLTRLDEPTVVFFGQ